jgi:cell division septal protein FtsQ
MAVVGALAALGGGAWAGYRWLTSSPRFALTQITVAGAHHVDADELRAQLPIRIGDNAFVDLNEVARSVRTNPWVASASVRRVLPHTLAIELHEHVAAAVVELGDLGERYLCDDAGRPFKRIDGDAEGLPLITGLDRATYAADPEAGAHTVRDAIAAAAAWAASGRPAAHELQLDPHGALTLRAGEPALAIQLGALGSELATRMRTFDAAWAALSDAERSRARAIHLGVRPDHVTVAFARN